MITGRETLENISAVLFHEAVYIQDILTELPQQSFKNKHSMLSKQFSVLEDTFDLGHHNYDHKSFITLSWARHEN